MKAKEKEQTIIIKRIICAIIFIIPFIFFGQNDKYIKLNIHNRDTFDIFVPVNVMLMEGVFHEASIIYNKDTLFIIIDSVTAVLRGDISIQKIKHLPMCRVLHPKQKATTKLYSTTNFNDYNFIYLKYGKHIYYFYKKKKNKYNCYKYTIG